MSDWSDLVLSYAPGLWWRYEETGGSTAADSSGNARDGTITSLTLGETGPTIVGEANKSFRGAAGASPAYVERADEAFLDITGSFSLWCWVRWDTAATIRSFEAVMAKGDNAYRLARSSNTTNINFAADFSGGAHVNLTSSGVNPFDGSWHWVVGTYDVPNGDAFLWVDAVLRASNTALASNAVRTNNEVFRVGDNSNGAGTRDWQGWLDEPALLPGVVLTQADVDLLYEYATVGAPADPHDPATRTFVHQAGRGQ